MNDDIRGTLEEAGHRDVPEPRVGFASELQSRLQAIADEAPPSIAPPPPGDGRRWSAVGMLASLTAVVVLVVAIALVGGSDRSTGELELAEPVNVVVVLADGTTLRDPDGLLLPDGAVIRVGVGGSARIGDTVLAAGDSATVDDAHRLRIDRQANSAVTTPERTSMPSHPRTAPPTASSFPTRSPDPTTRPSAIESTGADSPAPTETPRPTRTPTASPTGHPTASPSATPPTDSKPLKLGARAVGPSEVQALWTRVPGARRYILIGTRSRHGSAADPVYPGAWVIGRFARRPANPVSISLNEAVVEVRLQVIVLGPGGVELTRSNIVTVSLRP